MTNDVRSFLPYCLPFNHSPKSNLVPHCIHSMGRLAPAVKRHATAACVSRLGSQWRAVLGVSGEVKSQNNDCEPQRIFWCKTCLRNTYAFSGCSKWTDLGTILSTVVRQKQKKIAQSSALFVLHSIKVIVAMVCGREGESIINREYMERKHF